MRIIGDFHIHSRYARACSKDLNIANLEKYAKLKGIDILGTGDFTHPDWIKELKAELIDAGDGIYKTKTGFPFIFQTEVSLIYTQGGKGRRVHHIILAPSLEVVEQINEKLSKRGNLRSDGRPIIGRYPSIELAEDMRSISDKIEIIPAHAWTPWFAIFGSMSGFDSVEECFGEKAKYIHAIETGMSSDPAMNWRVSHLDKYNPISNSDCHSLWPWRLGREANVFELKTLTYDAILTAIRTGKGLASTIEVDPNYGKYHFDGHRLCKHSQSPEQTRKNKICPNCKRPVTIGVAYRVEQLADRPEGFVKENAIPFKKLIPLSELIAARHRNGVATKKTWEIFHKLVKEFGSEYNVLLDAPVDRIKSLLADEKLAHFIQLNREENIKIIPGFDGQYGIPIFDGEKIAVEDDVGNEQLAQEKPKPSQKSLSEY